MKRFTLFLSISLFLFSQILLFLYSFTQVDLGLVLSRFSTLHEIQRIFQQIGYFERPLSAGLYIVIVGLLSLSYFLLLYFLSKNAVTIKKVFILSVLSAGILFLSYNAFSYDLFNYIFDAKIITTYGENPYEKKALDFPQDPMLGFMHWTHRVYPYGPVWLAMSLPLSYLSMGSLIANMLAFKGVAIASYLGTVYFLYKFVKQIALSKPAYHLGLFALHPLVLIESLVSAHNDIVMMFMVIFSLYVLSSKRFGTSVLFFFLSIGIKFATAFLAPIYGYILFRKNDVDWQKVITYSFLSMLVAVIAAWYRSDFQLQPWYMLYLLPFMALSKKITIVIPTIVVSLLAFFQYVPYLYTGNYDPPIPLVMSSIVSFSLILSSILLIIIYFIRKSRV